MVFLVVFGVNLLPAFGPPTWSIMVYFALKYDLNDVALIAVGVIAAASGRFVLAHASRAARNWLPQSYVTNMANFGEYLKQRSTHAWWLIATFFVSPLPSAQLFVAAGLMPAVELAKVTAAFAVGRIATYSLYVGIAHSLAATDVGQIIINHLKSPWGLASELAMLGLLVGIGRIDWRKRLHQ
ncbi:MAG: hypothetical protein RL410_303 [Actinomycetota bacterium]